MNKRLLLSIVSLAFLLTLAPFLRQASVPATAAPSRPSAVPGSWETVWNGSGRLLDLVCTDADTCFATGDAGLFLKTTDGGDTWRYQSLDPNRTFNALAFADAGRGLVVGQDGVTYRTADGGDTWKTSVTPNPVTLHGASMLGDGNVWVVGDAGAIFHSTDWGATWTAQTSNTPQPLFAVQFLDASSGFIAGDKGVVLATSDGGATWTAVANTFPSWATIYTLFFTDPQNGWIAGQVGHIRRTTDGGDTWQTVTSDFAGDIYDMRFAGAFGVFGGVKGTIATSVDGQTWTTQTDVATFTRDVRAVFPLNSTDIWAGGLLKANPDTGEYAWWITHSSDGATFSRKAGDFGLHPDLEAVSYPTKDVGYMVGHASALGKTTDGGDTWSWRQVSADSNHFFTSISCSTAERCWAAGRWGLVFSTTDGGASWNSTTVPGYASTLYDIVMLDNDNGQLAGNPPMFYTTDGGQNWLGSNTQGNNANVDISMIDLYSGWTSTRKLGYRWTTSGGQTWKIVFDVAVQEGAYQGVQTLDSDADGAIDQAWLVGCDGPLVNEECKQPQKGRIAHTPDGGDTWEYQPLPANTLPLIDIVMFDAKEGWVAGAEGQLLYTNNGGASWDMAPSSLPAGRTLITELDFADPSHGLGSVFSGYIIRYNGPGRRLGSYPQESAIVVDGLPGDWRQGGSITLDASTAARVLGESPTPADASAAIYSRWSNDALYLLAEIRDDMVMSSATDRFNLAIDGQKDGQLSGADDHILRIEANGSYTDTIHPDAIDGISVGVSRGSNGWVVEIGLSPQALGRSAFSEGAEVGLNLMLEDDDGASGASTLIWEGRDLSAKPATFGSIRLVGSNVVLANGAGGYDGAEDTYIERWDDPSGSTAHGADPSMKLIYSFGVLYSNGLLRFDLSDLPEGADVTQALLDIYVGGNPRVDTTFDIVAYRMLRPWDENTATWNQPAAGESWGSAGALAAGVDYDPTPLDTVTISAGETAPLHLVWDISAATDFWLKNPASNYGVMLMPTGPGRWVIPSTSEASSLEQRPSLSLSFALPARPATPTPTPMPTATATPTPTPTPTPTATPTPALARVHGLIYEDVNANGVHDASEPPLGDAQVRLQGEGLDLVQTTGVNGLYAFDDLPAGSYVLDIVPPAAFGPSTPETPLNLTLAPGNDLSLDFGHVRLPTATPTATPSPTATPTPTPQRLYLPLLRK